MEEFVEVVNQLFGINKQLKYEIKEWEIVEVVLKIKEKQLIIVLEKEKEFNEFKFWFVFMVFYEFWILLSMILFFVDFIEVY